MKSIDDLVGLTIGVQQGNTSRPIADRLVDDGLLRHITAAQEELEHDATLQQIRRKWLGNPHTDQSLATG